MLNSKALKKITPLAVLFLSGCAQTGGPAFLRQPPQTPPAPARAQGPGGRLEAALNIGFLLAQSTVARTVSVESEADRGFYTEKKLRFQDPALGSFAAALLLPKGGISGRPAVVGLFDCEGACPQDPALRPGADLARRSFVVIAALPHEDWLKDQSFCASLGARGLSLTGLRAYETLSMVSYLHSMKEVDERRIGAVGRRGASRVTEIAADLSPWIAARVDDVPPTPAAGAPECGRTPEGLTPALAEFRERWDLPSVKVGYGSGDADANEQTAAFFNTLYSSASFNAAAARAEHAAALGESSFARRLLEGYPTSGLSPDQQRRLLSLRLTLKDYAGASELVAEMQQSAPQDAGLWLLRAHAEAESGDAKKALDSTGKAVELKPAPDRLREAALLYQDLKEFPSAARLFGQLAQNAPAAAGPLQDLAVCEYLQGSADQAIKDLRKAIEIEPALMSPYLSLGSILSATHQDAEALKVYDAALAVPGAAPSSARDAVSKARAETLARMGAR